ncbi:MAG: pentapeptide repeat-containing protein [Nitrospinota bacterium]|nr:pentapeptide repeat-containing protein [Nitrospinota bacterium]
MFVRDHYRFFLITAIGLIELLLIHFERDFLVKLFAEPFNVVIPLFAAAPIALFIWYWRDQNKKADIQNAKEELIQKDFHEIQKWAIGIEGDKERTLQIAAIHQLKPFAIGKHGERFRRPAYEIYFSLLQTWQPEEVDEDTVVQNYIKAIHTVFREEGGEITKKMVGISLAKADLSKANLNGVNLDWAVLKSAHLSKVDLKSAHLRGTKLKSANLYEANLQSAFLEDAALQSASLIRANLQSATLVRANLQFADLREANLKSTNFLGANLESTNLEGVNLQSVFIALANLKSAKLIGAKFNNRHVVEAENWDKAIYGKGALEELRKVYEEAKRTGEGGYWDPEIGDYVSKVVIK